MPSGSSAPLTPAHLEISTPVLPGSTLDSTLPIAPATPAASPQIPQVDAIAQTLAPGTYDVSVSPTTPAIATPLPTLSPAVATPSPVPSVVEIPPVAPLQPPQFPTLCNGYSISPINSGPPTV
ncbi:hypothetical protein [Leptodesmis sp.]|uniref:hypothetical protein n=1 Tax=Leptodesmis sp. TaxID=3100501 RepID=UPI0040534AE5